MWFAHRDLEDLSVMWNSKSLWNSESLLIQTTLGISVLSCLCYATLLPLTCSNLFTVCEFKELVITEMSETTTWHSARPHWVAMLANALMVQKWVKIYIPNTVKFKAYCKCSSNFSIFYNACWVLLSCVPEAQIITLCVDWILPKEGLNQGYIKDGCNQCQTFKRAKLPKEVKHFRIPIAIIALSDNLEKGPPVLLGAGNCWVLFLLNFILQSRIRLVVSSAFYLWQKPHVKDDFLILTNEDNGTSVLSWHLRIPSTPTHRSSHYFAAGRSVPREKAEKTRCLLPAAPPPHLGRGQIPEDRA